MTVHRGQNWRKSSLSHPSSDCLELCTTASMIAIRDSKNPVEQLHFLPNRFRPFTTHLKNSGQPAQTGGHQLP
jgi:uncharacterized protein DUF397